MKDLGAKILSDLVFRKQILDGIFSAENVCRKRKSFGDYQIYNDNAYKYVRERLVKQLGVETTENMQIMSQLNVAKRMVQERASIYNTPPERLYSDITNGDKEALTKMFSDCGYNTVLGKANQYYCLRHQTFLQSIVKNGRVHLKVIHGHNIDVIPDEADPELAAGYIVSSFDKTGLIASDGTNQVTADPDDGKKHLKTFYVYTKDFTFVMDGNGKINPASIIPNEIGLLPFVDVAKDKDLQFFVELGQALTDFTVDFNVVWSDLMYTMRLQNFSIGVVTGDPALKPVQMIIGANKWLFMPTNPNNPESKLNFEFKNPSPQIDSSLKAIESLITTFLTTQGLDTKAVQVSNNGQTGFSSALERLLAMIDQYIATKEDFDLFKVVEKEVHKITCAQMAYLSGSEFLLPDYVVTQGIVDSQVEVKFHEPQMIETQLEKLTNGQKEIDLGLSDKVQLYAKLKGVSVEQAEKDLLDLHKRKIEFEKKIAEINAAAGVEPEKKPTEGDPAPNDKDEKPVGGENGTDET